MISKYVLYKKDLSTFFNFFIFLMVFRDMGFCNGNDCTLAKEEGLLGQNRRLGQNAGWAKTQVGPDGGLG